MKDKLRKVSTYVVRFMRHNIGFFLLVTLTACAAVNTGAPMAQTVPSTIRVVQFSAEQVNQVLDNPTVYDLYTYSRPDGLCPGTCWLSWSDGGERYFALSQLAKNTLSVLPRGLQVNPSAADAVEVNIYNSGWTVIGKYALVGLAVYTHNPGLLSIDVMEFDAGNIGMKMLESMYPKVVD
jgi:hypothetical protein